MTYKETTEYLFTRTPLFQNVGGDAYKEGLSNTHILDNHFGHPHKKYSTIHIAGTNGKGSCSHTIASILQEAGYKVGLFTSPHLLDFRERIRINGEMISEDYVTNFVEQEKNFFEPLYPSFFELTTAMAFKYFAEENVDIAVIEVGLGGRLDCTNIITPIVSIITNISFDHTQFLGSTLQEIASEKAGIIKKNIPVVIGETTSETRPVFLSKAKEEEAPIIFAENNTEILRYNFIQNGRICYETKNYGNIDGELGGEYQIKNTNTILSTINIINESGFITEKEHIRNGFSKVSTNTGLMGRWQHINESPLIVCDTGHNTGGFKYLSEQIKHQECDNIRIVFGMVNDKDVCGVLELLPKNAVYYFCQPNVKRALAISELMNIAKSKGLEGKSYKSVADAYKVALEDSSEKDFIYIGGSSFVVADLLAYLKSK